MANTHEPAAPVVTDAAVAAVSKRQKARSFAIAGGLIFLVLLFYLITIFKLGGTVVNRSI
jgi:uncharacterized integral membrane protein